MMQEKRPLFDEQIDQLEAPFVEQQAPLKPVGLLTAVSPSELRNETLRPQGMLTALKQSPETWGQMATRNITTVGKGITQKTVGFPGDVQSFLGGVGKVVGRGVGIDVDTPFEEKILKLAPGATPEEQKEIRSRYGQFGSMAGPGFPTSREVGKGIETASQKLFGVDPSYFKSKGKAEKILHSSTKDAVPVAISSLIGYGPATFAWGAVRSIAPNLVKMGAKGLGFSKGAQRLAKGATQFFLSFMGGKDVKAAKRAQFEATKQTVKATDKVTSSQHVREALKAIEKDVETGLLEGAHKTWARKELSKFNFLKSKKAKINVLDALEDKNQLGRWMRDQKVPPLGRKYASSLRKAFVQDLEHYGKTANKAFGKSFKLQEDFSRELARNTNIFDWMIERLPEGAGAITKLTFKGKKLGLAGLNILASAIGVNSAIQVADRLFRSPAMRRYYLQAIAAATKKNAAQFGNAIAKFDKASQSLF